MPFPARDSGTEPRFPFAPAISSGERFWWQFKPHQRINARCLPWAPTDTTQEQERQVELKFQQRQDAGPQRRFARPGNGSGREALKLTPPNRGAADHSGAVVRYLPWEPRQETGGGTTTACVWFVGRRWIHGKLCAEAAHRISLEEF